MEVGPQTASESRGCGRGGLKRGHVDALPLPSTTGEGAEMQRAVSEIEFVGLRWSFLRSDHGASIPETALHARLELTPRAQRYRGFSANRTSVVDGPFAVHAMIALCSVLNSGDRAASDTR